MHVAEQQGEREMKREGESLKAERNWRRGPREDERSEEKGEG